MKCRRRRLPDGHTSPPLHTSTLNCRRTSICWGFFGFGFAASCDGSAVARIGAQSTRLLRACDDLQAALLRVTCLERIMVLCPTALLKFSVQHCKEQVQVYAGCCKVAKLAAILTQLLETDADGLSIELTAQKATVVLLTVNNLPVPSPLRAHTTTFIAMQLEY